MTKLVSISALSPDADAAVRRFTSFAMEHATDAVMCLTADGRFVYVNQAACTRLGYTRDELLQMSVPDISRSLRPGQWADIIGELRRRRFWTFETEHCAKDGRVFPVEISASFIAIDGQSYSCAFVRDVTARKEAEQALRRERDLVRSILDASPDAIVIADLDNVIVDCNRAACRMSGLAKEQIVGQSTYGFVTPADRARAVENTGRVLADGAVVSVEYVLGVGEREVPVSLSSGIVRDPAGAPVGFVGIVKDMTEQRRAQEALRRSEHLYRTTVDALGEWIHVVDDGLRFVLLNDSFRRVNAELGLPEDAAGRELGEIYPFLDDTRREQYRTVLREQRSLSTLETTVIGGRTYITETQKVPVFEGDRVARVVTVIKDVTALKRAEQAQRESEDRFRAIFESAADCIFLKDRRLRYTQVNPAMERLFGAPAAELCGRTDEELFGAAAAPHLLEIDRRVLGGEIVHEENTKPVHGEPRTFSVVKVPLRDPAGIIVGLCGIARDITAQRQAEEERRQFESYMQQTQKLDSLGVLAGGIAHDFNNLLTTILGHAELALMALPPTSPARRDVNKILTGARRAAELTQQMLAYSGRGRFATELVGLSELVEEMAHLLQVSIPKRCRLASELGDDLPGIEVDPGQVRQVVMNLLLNAAEAVGEGSGLITVRTSVRDCDRRFLAGCALGKELPEGRYVALEVTDCGCGIDTAVLGKIFEPFFTTKFTGRGLGLAAVLGIVRGHDGAIHVASEPGRGTTFQVLFPAARAAAEAPAPAAGPGEWRGAGTLLLVDDEPAVRALAREMLERLGFTVRCASGGRGALRTLRANAACICAVILDESVPDMDGLELLRAVRGVRPELPVVLASAQGEQAVRSRYGAEGLAGCVQKPFLMDELRAAVRKAVGG